MSGERPTPRAGGFWCDSPVRQARKAYICDNTPCKAVIPAGGFYLEGDGNPYRAGGFGRDRYCMGCQGGEPPAA